MTNSAADRSTWYLLLGGSLCVGAYLFLTLGSQAYGMASLAEFFIICCFTSMVTAGLWLAHQQQKLHIACGWVLVFGCLFRMVGVFAYPLFEDDFFRYLWDGRMVAEFGTPYGVAPAEFFTAEHLSDSEASILDRINYPEVPTVYGPVAQWFFGLCYWVAPGSLKMLQVALAVADIGVLVLLLRLATPAAAMLYAFSPLIIKEFSMSAHVDVLGVLFLVTALLAYKQQRWWLIGVMLALAAGVKVFALVAAPFLLGLNWRAWLSFLVAGVVVAWPFGLANAWLPDGLQVMGSQWLFNSPLHLMAHQWDWLAPRWVMPGLLLAFALLWLWQYGRWLIRWYHSPNGGLHATNPPSLNKLPLHWLFGIFLLILPAINPWYLVWWLPFAVLTPAWTPWVAATAVLLSYASGINLSNPDLELALYQIPTWILLAEFLAIGLAVALDVSQWRRRLRRQRVLA